MATPATSSVQKRYTTGSCTLDVALQLSALSQWYPQPIVQDLQFKLWMQPVETIQGTVQNTVALPRLVAKGDRAALQVISQYLSQKVQSELAIAHLSKSAPPPPAQPPFLQLTQPLSYLQLCDLTIVMNQCEQAHLMLPVAIASTTQELSPSAVQAASDINDRSDHRQSANNVISLAAFRRRPKLWASSAAAALLAVGLTTAVWQNSQNNPQLTTATAPSDFEQTPSNADLALPKAALPKDAVKIPESVEVPQRNVPPQIAKLEQNNPRIESQGTKPKTLNSAEPDSTVPRPSAGVSPQVIAVDPGVETVQPPADTIEQNIPQPSLETAETVPRSPVAQVPEAEARSLSEPLEAAIPSSAARRASPIPSDIDSDMGAVMDEGTGASSTPASEMITQAQAYFQNQWDGTDVVLENALSYTMSVSDMGKIVRFEAEGAAAEGYRDRLQPKGLVVNMTPERLEAIAGVIFRLKITPDGQVQIAEVL